MRTVTVKLPELYLQYLDDLVERGVYASRSEAVRAAVRLLIKRHMQEQREQRTARKVVVL